MIDIEHGSLFSGIGGFDLAAQWVGWINRFHCDINEFGNKVLKYYWSNATSHEDITQTDFAIYRGLVHVLSGGFPCQGFSLAGKRLGTDDNRYLWPQMLRAVREIHPIAIVGENVTGILSMEDKSGIWADVFPVVESRKITRFASVDKYEALYTRQAKMLINTICEDLEKEGYQVQPFAIPAAGIGAPHKRERIWIIAQNTNKNGWDGCLRGKEPQTGRLRNTGSGNTQRISSNNGETETDANPTSERLQGSGRFYASSRKMQIAACNKSKITSHSNSKRGCSRNSGRSDATHADTFSERIRPRGIFEGWPTQPPLCSRNDGLSSRLSGITFSKHRNESIKAFGNSIMPQIAFEIFKALNTLIKEQLS